MQAGFKKFLGKMAYNNLYPQYRAAVLERPIHIIPAAEMGGIRATLCAAKALKDEKTADAFRQKQNFRIIGTDYKWGGLLRRQSAELLTFYQDMKEKPFHIYSASIPTAFKLHIHFMNLGAFFAAPVWKRRKKPGYPLVSFARHPVTGQKDTASIPCAVPYPEQIPSRENPAVSLVSGHQYPAWTKNIDTSSYTTRKLTTKTHEGYIKRGFFLHEVVPGTIGVHLLTRQL